MTKATGIHDDRELLINHFPKKKGASKGYPEFNPDQDRDESGKWTTGGAGASSENVDVLFDTWDEQLEGMGQEEPKKYQTVVMKRSWADKKITEHEIAEMRREFIERFADAPYEYILYINDERNEATLITNGSPDTVYFNDHTSNLIYDVPYAIHNHPTDRSFSLPDVKMQLKLETPVFEVVSEKYIYRLERPEGFESYSENQRAGLTNEFYRLKDYYKTQLFDLVDRARPGKARAKAREKANLELNHSIWVEWARENGLKYSRRPRA